MTTRAVVEATQRQGIDEIVTYNITTTPWGTSPTTCSLGMWERISGCWTNVTTDTTTGTILTVGDIITLPGIKSLEEGHTYRAITVFTASGNMLSCYFDIVGEK